MRNEKSKVAAGIGALVLAYGVILTLASGGSAFPQGTTGADSDGDGIPDSVEINGIDYTSSDGSHQHLDLKALGASPTHKDILVWVDWMGKASLPIPHDHRPNGAALQLVKDSFSNLIVPQLNPDGTKGINLIVVISPSPVPHQDLMGSTDEPSLWAAVDTIKNRHFPKELSPYLHYCLFAHDINLQPSGTSGISRGIPGHDFIVSLGSWGNSVGIEDEQAGTFMHELGHNLGLHHGGGEDTNYKPNYLSIMSYFFQMDGLLRPAGGARFDYSHTALRDLNELDLDETQPLTSDPQFQGWNTLYFCPGQTQAGDPVSVTGPVDWNCNGGIDQQHVSAYISGSTVPTTLAGYDDWDAISLTGGLNMFSTAGVSPPAQLSLGEELNLVAANRIDLPPVQGLSALSANGAVALSWTPLTQSRVVGYKVTKTDSGGTQTMATTTEPRYVDSSKPAGEKGNTYEVQALYLPHGFAGTIKLVKTEAGVNGLSVKGSTIAIAARYIVDPKLVGALQQQSRMMLQKMYSSAEAGISSMNTLDIDRAVKTRTATVLLQTKPALLVVH